ncbi:hypothetical protein [Bradyrhizobium tunisiense]|uniref:hypothetical protein n=1 Tax=Bradyrhizobium tunisiense TaxID=3278709 RepID=UPI0035E3A1E4
MTAYAAVLEARDLAEKEVTILRRVLLKKGASVKTAGTVSASQNTKRVKLVRKKKA